MNDVISTSDWKERATAEFNATVVGRHGGKSIEGAPFCGLLADCARSLVGRAGTCLSAFLSEPDESRRDVRLLRAHLMLEELGELLAAMSRGDELETLDGLADLDYVVNGSAVEMDLPLAQAFAEVHRSNMSKSRQTDDAEGARIRSKGPNYVPPDLRRVLKEHRTDDDEA